MTNSIPQKSQWPKTGDGTTDWQALFGDEQTGLIAIVMTTQNSEQLKQQTELIVQAIFSRKKDKSVRGNVTAFLDKLIPEAANEERLGVMQATVVSLLEKIKIDRINRAAAYVAKKGKGKKSKKKNRRPNIIVGLFRSIADGFIFSVGLFSRGGKDKPANKKKRNNSDKAAYFKQDAYVDQGGDGNTEWQDAEMPATKDAKVVKPGAFESLAQAKPDNDKYESWEDY